VNAILSFSDRRDENCLIGRTNLGTLLIYSEEPAYVQTPDDHWCYASFFDLHGTSANTITRSFGGGA
jgi:hypothetical protein